MLRGLMHAHRTFGFEYTVLYAKIYLLYILEVRK